MRRFVSVACVACVVSLSASAGQASAGEPAPGWEIFSRAVPSNFSAHPKEGFPDGYEVTVRNAGSQPTDGSPVTISDTLPEGVTATEVVGYDLGPGLREVFIHAEEQSPVALKCELRLRSVMCVDGSVVMPGDTLTVIITVKVSSEIPEGQAVVNTATISGGGASAQTSSISTPVQAGALPFGLENVIFTPAGVEGAEDTEAGGHPYELTTTFYLNTHEEYHGAIAKTPEDTKDVVVELPPGFVGNPQVVQKCSQILAGTRPGPGEPGCPPSSQIGVARLGLRNLAHNLNSENVVPVYNVQPSRSAAAQFEFFDAVPVTLVATANQETNYAIRVTVSDIPREAEFNASSLTFFGEPATNHDIYNRGAGVGQSLAFLQNPVDCSAGPLHAKVSIDSWQHPGSYLPDGSPNLADPNWKTYTTTVYPSLSGCNLLQFEPSIALTPSTTQADEPTGVNVDLRVPQAPNRLGELATPELKDATVTLPAGLSLSPSAADGLGACTNEQIDIASIEAGSCPEDSVLGTIRVSVPLLESPLEGQVFLGEPECDPCTAADAADGRMIRLFIEGSGSGVRLKKEGRVYLNPSTGQLTSKFEDNPQDPFENLELDFKSGLRAGLATPQTCGTATTTTDLQPWSSPITPDANPISQFNVSWDGKGAACPAVPPLSPSFSAGTSNPNAGQFSPFTLTFAREDREQDLAGSRCICRPGCSAHCRGSRCAGSPKHRWGRVGRRR